MTSLVVLLCIVVPGFLRIEDTASKASDTADELALTEAREGEEEEQEELLSCQTRNTFQQNTRVKFQHFIDAIEVAFVASASSPERAEATKQFIDQLRASVESKPEDEDRDCNEDGKYDAVDYLP